MKEKLHALIDKYDAKIRELEAEGKMVSTEAKSGFDQNIEDLKRKRDELREQLKTLTASASENTVDLKNRLKNAARELKAGSKRAKRQLKNK